MADSARIAVAVFVKTPGLSPVKTRLAAEIGRERAEAFYRLAVEAVESVLVAVTGRDPNVVPVWAVAEAAGMASATWARFLTIRQGEGGLGARMDRVYATLRKIYDGVVLAGADSPHLDPARYLAAVARLREAPGDFVVLPTADGGFSLFGGTRPIPTAAWAAPAYSAATTLTELEAALAPTPVYRLAPGFDVDTLADLRALAAALPPVGQATAAQERLRDWLLEGTSSE